MIKRICLYVLSYLKYIIYFWILFEIKLFFPFYFCSVVYQEKEENKKKKKNKRKSRNGSSSGRSVMEMSLLVLRQPV